MEDPGARLLKGTSENVARGSRPETWEVVLERARQAAGSLRTVAKGPGGLEQWLQRLSPEEDEVVQPAKRSKKVCRWFQTNQCWDGASCRMVHEASVRKRAPQSRSKRLSAWLRAACNR